ncbi:hypothetical protein [Fusobacterium hominis]|uniref:hypothetical protein n=1 Tax=Fusobacterium hominis TaxID=2764326 RepID=UPI0022DF735F|nr:hypothetical protein [Fusobacterium hominis]
MKKYYFFIVLLLSISVSIFGKDIVIDTNIFSAERLSIPNAYYPISIVRAKMEVIIENQGDNPDDYFEFSAENINGRGIDKVQILTPHYYATPPIYYFRDNNGNFLKKLRLIIDCYIHCDVRYLTSNIFECKLGTLSNGDRIFVLCDAKEYKPIHNLKIEVKDDMNLGTTYPGGTLSTRNNGTGTPAKIIVSGQRGKRYKVKIPKETIIHNDKKNDQLHVYLRMRNEQAPFLCKQDREYTEYIIDGICKTNKRSSGHYKGSFVVRVEYIDEA